MKKLLVNQFVAVFCTLAGVLSTAPVLADWSYDGSKFKHNQQFGDFPPENIDQQLLENRYIEEPEPIPTLEDKQTRTNQGQTRQAEAGTGNQVDVYSAPQSAAQQVYTPYYGGYNQAYNRSPYGNNTQWNNRGPGYNAPWGNNRSSFGGPWNGNGSGFSMPWGNNNSGFSGPWNNNSGFRPRGN